MKTAKQIRNAVENVRYYANEVDKLAREQMNSDVEQGNKTGINASIGTVRFDALGAISSASNWIEVYCENILTNLKTAEAQDKLLHTEEEVEYES